MLTAYQVLGVPEDATLEIIRARYQALMKSHHPDANPNADPRIAVGINRAFHVLKAPGRRQTYDAMLARRREAQAIPARFFVFIQDWPTSTATTSNCITNCITSFW